MSTNPIPNAAHVHSGDSFKYDANGNITAYISESGTVSVTYAYGPFGETIAHTGLDFEHRFSTKPYNGELGTYTYIYREYSPTLGRWLSENPILEQGGFNLYSYCGNEPVGNFDYNGMSKLFEGCCNGQKYNRLIKCCRDGVTYKWWELVDTEVKICSAHANRYKIISHRWLEIKNKSIDFVAGGGVRSIFGGKGKITIGTAYYNDPEKVCITVQLQPCKYDIQKFEESINDLMYYYGIYVEKHYDLLTYNCINFVDELVATARKMSVCHE